MTRRTQAPRCARHGRELTPAGTCALCRADALAEGRERPTIDTTPRCEEHDLPLNAFGLCRSCRAEQIADNNPRPQPPPTIDRDSVNAAGAELVRTALRAAPSHPAAKAGAATSPEAH